MPVLGQFEDIHQERAVGWALVTEQPAISISVEIMDGDTVVATGFAQLRHKTLTEKGIGNGKYGFAIPLPAVVLRSTRVLRARAAGTGEWIKGEHTPALPDAPETPVGNIDGMADGILFGWVVGAGKDESPEVEIHLAGKKITSVSVGSARPDIVALGIADTAYSYRCDLNPFLKNRRAALTSGNLITLIHVASGKQLAGSPLNLAEAPVWGNADKLNGLELNGWATISVPRAINQHAIVELWIDGAKSLEVPAKFPRADFARMGVSQSRCGFKIGIPGRYLDGQAHSLTLRHQATGATLANGAQEFTATLRHAITRVTASEISGWLFVEQAPLAPITIEAREDGCCIARAQANQPYPVVPADARQQFGVGPVGFTLTLPPAITPGASRRIRLCLAGQTESLTGRDILIAPRAELIRQVEHAARQDSAFRWWAQDWIAQLRQAEAPDGTLYKQIPAAAAAPLTETLDVIIPVYKGREETLACIQSLLDCPDPWQREIIVINDASPDVQLTTDLRALATQHPITMLENPGNLGFVASVNRGMKLHLDRDVILLNADTLVPASDWLSRLRAAAYSDETIATVTPFSNRATICSLPSANVDNDLPDGLTVTDLDQRCAQSNPSVRVDIPTAVGFCMFIKRGALSEVGIFDEERWAKGYGEENDFCIRAAAIGWKHVAACDVFVQHHGAVSFQGEKHTRVQENLNRLNALYPDYPDTITNFIQRDPLSAPRSRVVLHLMKQHAKRHVLHITHAWGGGVHQHVDQLCQRPAKKGEGALILRPTGDSRIEILQPQTGLALSVPADALADINHLSNPAAPFLGYLQDLGVTAIHLHQWIGLPPAVWQIPAALGLPLDYTAHDYYSFCPRINLLDHTGQFCEQASLARCEHCVKARALEPEVERAFDQLGGTVAAWRDFHQTQLVTARSITAPCLDAATRIQRAFALKRVSAKPHDEPIFHFKPKPLPKPGQEMRVALIGAIGPNKGYDQLLALAQLAEAAAPHIHFFIVGYTMDDTPFAALANVQITGKYAPKQLQGLLDELDCHIALFLSPWPETYSYTLSEALRAGLTPVVPALGALGERVAAMNVGITMPIPLSPSRVLDVLTSMKARSGEAAGANNKIRESKSPPKQRRLSLAE